MLQYYQHSITIATQVPYFLDQTTPSNSRRTQIVAASFTYLSLIVAALELSPHVLIRTHLPRPSIGDVYVRIVCARDEPCLLQRSKEI